MPADYPTITEAVDAAVPGDLILISPGVYNEAVNVTTDELTIRGLDRNEVILDGELELDNGIRVLGAKGVAIENMTARNYTNNGFFWTGVDGYRGSYLTATRNGDYGIYAYDSTHGLLEHSYASGSPDAGFYIGQCFECDAVIDDVISEYNGLGYSGTTSGGNLYIINSRFNNNRAGINTNSATYELCYPQRQLTVVGNLVYSNNQPDTPAIDDAILAMGNGILVEGGIGNVIERNRVYDHAKTGIGIIPLRRVRAERHRAEPRHVGSAVFGDAQQAARRSRVDRADLLDAAGQLGRRQRRRSQRRGRPRDVGGGDRPVDHRPHRPRQLLRRQHVHDQRTGRHRGAAAL